MRTTFVATTMTERDFEILRWVARVRFASGEQVAARFSMEQSKCYKRLKLLVRKGLAQRKLMLQNQPGVYHVTRAGLKTVGIADMAVPTVSLQSFLHDLAVVWEQTNLERSAALVLSEREMRYYEKTTAEDYRVQIPGHLADDARTHRPDLIFRVGAKGGLHAVEVELALKSEARLVAILSAYARLVAVRRSCLLRPECGADQAAAHDRRQGRHRRSPEARHHPAKRSRLSPKPCTIDRLHRHIRRPITPAQMRKP